MSKSLIKTMSFSKENEDVFSSKKPQTTKVHVICLGVRTYKHFSSPLPPFTENFPCGK